jgi:hypothetical protein
MSLCRQVPSSTVHRCIQRMFLIRSNRAHTALVILHAAPNARSILHSTSAQSPSSTPSVLASGPRQLSLRSPHLPPSATASLSPIVNTAVETSITRHELASFCTPPAFNDSSSDALLSLESSLRLAAQVAEEHVQKQRPRSAFSPPAAARTQISSTSTQRDAETASEGMCRR